MARRPRSDKADRVEAIFADFDLLPIKDARFVVRAIRIALAVKERNQALAEAPTSQLTIPISAELKTAPGESSQARIVLSGAVQRTSMFPPDVALAVQAEQDFSLDDLT